MDLIFSENRKIPDHYIASFDLDRTLISEISGNVLVKRAWKEKIISLTDAAAAIYFYVLYKLNFRNPLKIMDDMTGWLKGIPEVTLLKLCSEVCNEILLPSLFDDAVSEIARHKENGARVIILSSSLNFICGIFGEKLGMDDYICSLFETENGYFTGKPLGRLCYGEEKLRRLNAYCIANAMNLADSWYYGDSISDLSVLSAVGKPVCVNPDRNLEKEAHKRGWNIRVWDH